jgi:hypothetical protein
VADKNNTFEDLKKKALVYDLETPAIRYDKTLLSVGVSGDLGYGGQVRENSMRTLKLDVKCLSTEDAFVEIQLMITKQTPTSVMIKRICSQGTKVQDGYLGLLIKTLFKLVFAILKFAILLLFLAAIAVLCDRYVISKIIDPYLSSFKNKPSKLNKNNKGNEPLGDIVELRTLTNKKQYGTLN